MSHELHTLLRSHMVDGWLSFEQFLRFVQHHPLYGYYGGGYVRFGQKGDFFTAPTLSPFFGQTLAREIAPVLSTIGGSVLELGAGDGHLAKDILSQWQKDDCLHTTDYYILETSAALKARQQNELKDYPRVTWLDRLPQKHVGIILANEVLDSVPFRLFCYHDKTWWERGISFQNDTLSWAEKLPDDDVCARLYHLNLPEGYQTEISPGAEALVMTLAQHLHHGLMIFSDYGFGRQEYYHPHRMEGTMLCHYRHQVDSNPLVNIGRKDITTHIDFTAIADAGIEAGAQLMGYTTQSYFLTNAGITDLLSDAQKNESYVDYTRLVIAVQKILAWQEMGEIFKWMAFSKGDIPAISGFSNGDFRHRL